MGHPGLVTGDRPCILLNTAELDTLFTELGIFGYRNRAAHLRTTRSVLHRACTGHPVNAELICAVRTTFPHVTYEQLFREAIPSKAAA